MFPKLALLLAVGLAASVASASVVPHFNFSHVSESGHFFASYRHHSDEDEWSNSRNRLEASDSDRIFGGSYATVGQFPFMAVIHRLVGNGKFFVCGGTILSTRWVLTAGHCMNENPRKFLVAFGVVDKTNFGYDYIKGEGVAMLTSQGALHPEYSLGKNDIGLLYMPKDIPFGETIKPIRIAGSSYLKRVYTQQVAHIYGWGQFKKNSTTSLRLKYGTAPIISTKQCRKSWNVDETQICINSSIQEDVCQGDSGGPLIVLEEDDEPLQIGVVSFGEAGCPSIRPSVFTKVAAYTAWIKNVTGIHYD